MLNIFGILYDIVSPYKERHGWKKPQSIQSSSWKPGELEEWQKQCAINRKKDAERYEKERQAKWAALSNG